MVPRRVFIVAQKIGGQVMGAFDGGLAWLDLPWLCPASPRGGPICTPICWRSTLDYRNQGIGRRLKLFQRDEALARGITRMEWTFDPLEIKNSFLNVAKLGAIVRRYAANFYGVSSSRLHGQVPTDRLYAEWWLDSDWVCSRPGRQTGPRSRCGAGNHSTASNCSLEALACGSGPLSLTSRPVIASILNRRSHASWPWLALGSMQQGNGVFQLGRWQEPSRCEAHRVRCDRNSGAGRPSHH